MWTLPASDKYWDYLEGTEEDYPFDEDGRGGYSWAFRGIEDTKPLFVAYSRKYNGAFVGYIGWAAEGSAVWEMANLDEDDNPTELEVLEALTEYEAGALDFVTQLRDYDWSTKEGCVWCDTFEAVDEAEARRHIEQVLLHNILPTL